MSRLVYAAAASICISCTYNAFLIKVKQRRKITNDINFDDIMDDYDVNLRKRNSIITASTMPTVRHSSLVMIERNRGHKFDLQNCNCEKARQSFINRMLFKYAY